MVITGVEYMLAGMWVLQTLSAAVSAMPTPKTEGWYSFLYKFAHSMTNNLDAYFEKHFNVVMPRVVDETASLRKVTTPEGNVVETAVATKSTSDPQ